MTDREFALEKEKLERTLELVNKLLASENKELQDLFKDFLGTRDELWAIADMKKVHIRNLEYATDKPYFARVDFEADDGEKTTVYIGKNGIFDNTNVVVTDWRAPISSLYYDAEVGPASYEAPYGTISGKMNLKRQFEINDGVLEEYFDVNLVSNDALLQKYLNANNDARLRTIVSTIQKEQNEVIRKSLVDNLIVQGVAGSGKTTVALHRIAYLVYNYMKTIKQNQYLVIGPNPVFLRYIQSVLPDLDVSGVEQNTFEGFTKNYIDEDIIVNPSEKKVNASISGKMDGDIDKFKCSMKYKDMVEAYLNDFYDSITEKDLMLGDFKVLDHEVIKQMFIYTSTDIGSFSLDTRIERTINYLKRYVEDHINEIYHAYSDYTYDIFKAAETKEEKDKLRNKFSKDRDEIGKFCGSIIRKYFSRAKITATKAYKNFITNIEKYDLYDYPNLKELKKTTLAQIKKGTYDFEDLAALLYIKCIIKPDQSYSKVKHTVIDEAQDLGKFNFYALRKSLPVTTFSIFGDLAQSIYDYRGVDNWDDVNNIMFNSNGQVVNFNKSYRTTSEIMEKADDVADSIGLNRSDLVVRHGSPVTFTHLENDDDIPRYIKEKIDEYVSKGYKRIAIISKTDLLSRYLNDDLVDLGVLIPNVSLDDDLADPKFNICTISNQLAKGLEFDAVIINNASEYIYNSNNKLDMKLLYVAITRALHELDIVYTKELTKPLDDGLEKENVEHGPTLKRR